MTRVFVPDRGSAGSCGGGSLRSRRGWQWSGVCWWPASGLNLDRCVGGVGAAGRGGGITWSWRQLGAASRRRVVRAGCGAGRRRADPQPDHPLRDRRPDLSGRTPRQIPILPASSSSALSAQSAAGADPALPPEQHKRSLAAVMTDITTHHRTQPQPRCRHRSYLRVVTRACHSSYRVKKPHHVDTRHDSSATIKLANLQHRRLVL